MPAGPAEPVPIVLTAPSSPRLSLAHPQPQADEVESSPDPDTAQPAEPQDPDQPQASTSYGGAEAGGGAGGLVRRQRSALRRYVESFDQETMLQMAR